ncbi:MAG: hypothetical protein RI562_11785 [Salibacter sp.]|uniref:hypothetical protein n=1 Tax=Salibacter sp. TaxID=2010995 RepID=UPI0028704EB4|nr:hypothetical protein [Salibacter sp.]MDR9399734.1 hypothetical protein [Salibacter sp.]
MMIKNPYIYRISSSSLFILIFSIFFVNHSCAKDNYEQIIFDYFVDSTLVSHNKLKDYCVYSSKNTYEVKYKTHLTLDPSCELFKMSKSFSDKAKAEYNEEISYRMKKVNHVNVSKLSNLCDTTTTGRKKLKFKMYGETHIDNYVIVTIELISKDDPYGYYLVYKLDKLANNDIELACFSRYYI